MRILDLRPATVRFMSSLWSRGSGIRGRQDSLPGHAPIHARLAARVADGLVGRRVDGRRPVTGAPFILSVGNLALGGTGKTPVVTALASELAGAGRRGVVLTRGYGSPLGGPLEVAPDNILAGDEARVMAGTLAAVRWTIVQSQRRQAGLDFLMQQWPETEIVIVEDGHQTANLGRDLDIVILDAWAVAGTGDNAVTVPVTGPVVPFGPWRESARGATRAGIWVLESDEDGLPDGPEGQAVTTFQRHLTLKTISGEDFPGCEAGKVAVLSGIARPASFEASLGQILESEPVLAIRCGDHAGYGPRVAEEIVRAVRDAEADHLVTTSKDWIKLAPFWPQAIPVLVADLRISWGHDKTLPALVGKRLDS